MIGAVIAGTLVIVGAFVKGRVANTRGKGDASGAGKDAILSALALRDVTASLVALALEEALALDAGAIEAIFLTRAPGERCFTTRILCSIFV